MIPPMGLRDDLIADHKDHRAGGERQAPGQERLGEGDRDHPDQLAYRLDQAGRRGHGQGLPPRVVQRQQGHRHGQALRDILEADSDRQGCCRAEIAGAEPDADRQSFGEIVQGNRNHEQPDPPQALRWRTFVAKNEVLVRRAFVDEPKNGSADQDPGDHHERRGGLVGEVNSRLFKSR